VSFKDNFKLVDCWMLFKRNTEQILQCKLEMSQFITTIREDILSMQQEIKKKLDWWIFNFYKQLPNKSFSIPEIWKSH